METIVELSHVQDKNEQPDDQSTRGKSLQALSGNCINKEMVYKGIKTLGFLALLILVLRQYGLDIWTKFQNHATTFVTKTDEADNLFTPPITIYMGNGLKTTVMKKYGINNVLEFLIGSEAVMNMSSVWDVFVEAAYIINRDFQIFVFMWDPISKAWDPITLLKGHNYLKEKEDGAGYDFNVTEYHTNLAGTCYQINSNFPLQPPNVITLALVFNESLSDIDIPKVHLLWLIQKFTIILQKILFKN